MPSPENEKNSLKNENPFHNVKILYKFLVSKNLLNKVKLSFEKERYDKSHDMGQIRGKIEKL